MAWALPTCGRTVNCRDRWSNVIRPTWSWKNAPARASVPTARAITVAIGTPPAPQRVESDVSATMRIRAVLGCSNSRVTSGLKLVSVDCGQSIEAIRSPGCQSRTPANSNPPPWNTLG